VRRLTDTSLLLVASGCSAVSLKYRRGSGDYLGLTLETVSRAFSILRDEKLLSIGGSTQRRFELLDREALAKFDALTSATGPKSTKSTVVEGR
jgi:hypothetical protein